MHISLSITLFFAIYQNVGLGELYYRISNMQIWAGIYGLPQVYSASPTNVKAAQFTGFGYCFIVISMALRKA